MPEIIVLRDALVVDAIGDTGGSYVKEGVSHGIICDTGADDYREWFNYIRGKNPKENIQKRNQKIAKNSSHYLQGSYLYLGYSHDHFGHFFHQCIDRIYSLDYENLETLDGIVILPWHNESITNLHFLKSMLKIFELPADLEIVQVLTPTIVEKLHVPEPGLTENGFPKSFYQNFLSKKKTNTNLNTDFPQKVVFSRRLYQNTFKGTGRLAGSNFIVEQLVNNGYFEVIPELYPLHIQMAFLKESKKIVMEEGSIVHLAEALDEVSAESLLIKRRQSSRALDEVFNSKFTNGKILDVTVDQSEVPAFGDINSITENSINAFINEFKGFSDISMDTKKFLDAIDSDLANFDTYKKLIENGVDEKQITNAWRKIALKNSHGSLKLNVEKLPSPEGVISWHVDKPSKIEKDFPKYSELHFSGWIASQSPLEARVTSPKNEYGNSKVNRLDVAKVYNSKGFDIESDCGFYFILPVIDREYRLEVRSHGIWNSIGRLSFN